MVRSAVSDPEDEAGLGVSGQGTPGTRRGQAATLGRLGHGERSGEVIAEHSQESNVCGRPENLVEWKSDEALVFGRARAAGPADGSDVATALAILSHCCIMRRVVIMPASGRVRCAKSKGGRSSSYG
jgi:hypothetical protein